MKKKIIPGLLLGVIALLLMLSVYPLQLWNGSYTDQYDSSQETNILPVVGFDLCKTEFSRKRNLLKVDRIYAGKYDRSFRRRISDRDSFRQ